MPVGRSGRARRRARRGPARGRAAGASHKDRAARARRSSRPKSRNGRSTARRRPAAPRDGRAAPPPRARGVSGRRQYRGNGNPGARRAARAAEPAFPAPPQCSRVARCRRGGRLRSRRTTARRPAGGLRADARRPWRSVLRRNTHRAAPRGRAISFTSSLRIVAMAKLLPALGLSAHQFERFRGRGAASAAPGDVRCGSSSAAGSR